MPGLLDFLSSPDAQFGLGLLGAAAPRAGGVNFGQGLQEALGYVDKQRQMKAAEMAQAQEIEYKKAVMAEHQQKQAMQAAAMAQAERKQQAMSQIFRPASQGAPAMNMDSMLPAGLQTGLPSIGAVSARPASIDVQKGLEVGMTADELMKMDGLRNIGMNEVARTIKGMQGGREVEQQMDKFGRPVGASIDQYRAPIEVATGDKKQFVDPYTFAPKASFAMGQTPDSVASNQVAWANNSLANQRFQFDKTGGVESGGIAQTGLNKQFGKPQAGYRWKADGSMEFIPGGPADQKAQLTKAGEGTVGGVVADLRDKYTQLDAENGIVSTNNRFGTNLGAAFGASGVGQTLNGMVGTKTQSARDSIAMTRPLLLQAIMKATGMSSKQMDSNAELKLYLATATDPQKGLEANLEALDRIESLYGGGNERFKANRPQASINNGWSIEKAR